MKIMLFDSSRFMFYLETGIGAVTALAEFHGRTSRFRVRGFDAIAGTAFSCRDHFHARHPTTIEKQTNQRLN